MTTEDVIREVQETAGEWLEMSEAPATLVAGILANRVIKLENHIKYLEKRLQCQQNVKNFN
jgi:hypothetical protein